MSTGEQHVELLFIPSKVIRQALVDIQTERDFWVKSCDYLKDDDSFAVLLVARAFPVATWIEPLRKKWESR